MTVWLCLERHPTDRTIAKRTLQSRHPSAFGANAVQKKSKRSIAGSTFLSRLLEKTGLNDAQVVQVKSAMEQDAQQTDTEEHAKRSIQGSSFLSRLLEKTGLNDAQVVQVKSAMEQDAQQTDSKEPAKRSIQGSSFISSILEKTGLSDNQVAQVKSAMEQHAQEADAEASSTHTKRSSSSFLTSILQKIGLKGSDIDQVQTKVEQEMQKSKLDARAEAQLGVALRETDDGKIEIPTAKRDEIEDEQAAEQIAAEAQMEQNQDLGRPVSIKFGENQLIKRDALVEEVRAWKATPEAKRAYEELEARNKAIDQALAKRWALCA